MSIKQNEEPFPSDNLLNDNLLNDNLLNDNLLNNNLLNDNLLDDSLIEPSILDVNIDNELSHPINKQDEKQEQNELCIILDPTLIVNPKGMQPIENNNKQQNQQQIHQHLPELMKTIQEHETNLYRECTQNGFVNAVLLAYNSHSPLRIRPDDIHCMLQLIFSTYINNNSEKFKHYFVSHQGKKELEVGLSMNPDIHEFTNAMSDLVKKNVINPDLLEVFETKYSTSTLLTQLVFKSLIFNTLKEYFSYQARCLCGIPSIILAGSIEDWNKLGSMYTVMKKFMTQDQECELKDWIPQMDIIMKMFIETRSLAVSGTIDAPLECKLLWERVISTEPRGSGKDNIALGGWISILVPYDVLNKVKDFSEQLPYLDISNEKPPTGVYYIYQNKREKFYGAVDCAHIQRSMFCTPITIIKNKQKFKSEIDAGISEYPHINQRGEVMTNFVISTQIVP